MHNYKHIHTDKCEDACIYSHKHEHTEACIYMHIYMIQKTGILLFTCINTGTFTGINAKVQSCTYYHPHLYLSNA